MNQPQTPDNEVVRLRKDLEKMKGEATREIMLRDKIEKRCEIAERELAEKTNEAARIREEAKNWHQHYRDEASKAQKCKQAYIEQEKEIARLMEEIKRIKSAAQAVIDRWETPLWKEAEPTASVIYRLRDALSTAPEEPANPTCSNTTHKFSHCDCKEPSEKDTSTETCPSQKDTEWRELGPDEERVNGQFTFDKPAYSDKCRICGEEYGFHMGGRGDEAFCRRTRRPLPKQEEMPLDVIEKHANSPLAQWSNLGCLRYLRDEIQKLKQK